MTQSSSVLAFDLSYSNSQFTFNLGPSQYQYLKISYLLLTGSPCNNCPGYPIWYNNQCIATCPVGTHYNPQTLSCIVCQAGSYWNGQQCITCTGGQIWNAASNACVCPPGTSLTGNLCTPNIITCQGGKVLNPSTNQC